MNPANFAIAVRDELWMRGVLVEERREHGEALRRDDEIIARDAFDAQLAETCDAALVPMRSIVARLGDARGRIVARATREDGRVLIESTLTLTIRDVSIVTTPNDALRDIEMLRSLTACSIRMESRALLPIVWRNGSASILFHEAAGHAAEHRCEPLPWPKWLHVDDLAGNSRADLLAGESPCALRRESFRDVPLPRMTNLVVSQTGAPYEVPHERIEVHLVAGGGFDSLDEMVTLQVAIADHVAGDRARRLVPFALHATRSQIAQSILGASGEPIRYPGVVCSSEGQEIVVGSFAPIVVTAELP